MSINWWLRVIRLICLVLLIFLLPMIGLSFGGANIDTGVFPNAQAVEKSLIRGKSTRADVQSLLGIPNGAGGAMLPGFGEKSEVVEPYDIWYYEDVEIENSKSESGIMVMNMRQQILVILFKGDMYYGYFWTIKEAIAEGR